MINFLRLNTIFLVTFINYWRSFEDFGMVVVSDSKTYRTVSRKSSPNEPNYQKSFTYLAKNRFNILDV